jgi:hypothetical protein
MKNRNGFVSNSSSSSFVVRTTNWIYDEVKDVKIITDAKIKKLKQFGFRETVAHSPHQIPNMFDSESWKQQFQLVDELKKSSDQNICNYGYEVTCNQDDVIHFLISNKISFVASCHYGIESILYDAKKDKVYIGVNHGVIMEIYGFNNNLLTNDKPSIIVMTGKKWLKKNK